jgi:hypothetical protein
VLKERYMKKGLIIYFAVIREEDPSNVGAKQLEPNLILYLTNYAYILSNRRANLVVSGKNIFNTISKSFVYSCLTV